MNPYLIALDFPPVIKSQLKSICYGLPTVEWVEEENFHLLLRYLGKIPEPSLGLVKEALQTISFLSFKISLQGVDHFHAKKGQGTLWTGVKPIEALNSLKKDVDKVLKNLEVAPIERSFHPHVTLGRYDQIDHRRLGEFLMMNSLFRSESIEITNFHLFSMHETPKRVILQKVETYEALPPDVYKD